MFRAPLPSSCQQEIALTKALLEAAFDGEDAQLLQLLDRGATLGKDMVRCTTWHEQERCSSRI